MEWYVYYHDFNGKEIKPYNVLGSKYIREFIQKAKKKYRGSKEVFTEELRKELMYRFWSKSEWEIVVSAWCGGDGNEAIKIDVYDQIRLNWQPFVDYCWSYDGKA